MKPRTKKILGLGFGGIISYWLMVLTLLMILPSNAELILLVSLVTSVIGIVLSSFLLCWIWDSLSVSKLIDNSLVELDKWINKE